MFSIFLGTGEKFAGSSMDWPQRCIDKARSLSRWTHRLAADGCFVPLGHLFCSDAPLMDDDLFLDRKESFAYARHHPCVVVVLLGESFIIGVSYDT